MTRARVRLQVGLALTVLLGTAACNLWPGELGHVDLPYPQQSQPELAQRPLDADARGTPQTVEQGIEAMRERQPELQGQAAAGAPQPPASASTAMTVEQLRLFVLQGNLALDVALYDPEIARTRVSAEEGKFEIEVPFANAYSISGTKNGYLQNSVSIDPNTDPLDDVLLELDKYDYGAEGIVMHGETMAPLTGVKVGLYDANDQLIQDLTTAADGKYTFSLEPEKDYRIKVEKEGFFKQSARISTKGKTSTVIRTDFKLFPLDVGTVVRLDNIYYDLAKWAIRPDAAKELDKLVQTLNDNPTVTIELSSHTDCRGKDPYNMDLSSKRAKSAVEYLIKQGIAKERLTSKGYGETKPVETCDCKKCTEDEHQRNRRTEFKVLSK